MHISKLKLLALFLLMMIFSSCATFVANSSSTSQRSSIRNSAIMGPNQTILLGEVNSFSKISPDSILFEKDAIISSGNDYDQGYYSDWEFKADRYALLVPSSFSYSTMLIYQYSTQIPKENNYYMIQGTQAWLHPSDKGVTYRIGAGRIWTQLISNFIGFVGIFSQENYKESGLSTGLLGQRSESNQFGQLDLIGGIEFHLLQKIGYEISIGSDLIHYAFMGDGLSPRSTSSNGSLYIEYSGLIYCGYSYSLEEYQWFGVQEVHGLFFGLKYLM